LVFPVSGCHAGAKAGLSRDGRRRGQAVNVTQASHRHEVKVWTSALTATIPTLKTADNVRHVHISTRSCASSAFGRWIASTIAPLKTRGGAHTEDCSWRLCKSPSRRRGRRSRFPRLTLTFTSSPARCRGFAFADLPVADPLVLVASLFALCAGTEDKKQGTSDFLAKQAPQFRGR
jgi:hypothetical protein